MTACGLFPAAIMARLMNTEPNLGSSISAVITATIRLPLSKARPAMSFACTAARFIFRMGMGLKANDGLTRPRTVTLIPVARSLDEPIIKNPLLLMDGQPTNVVRDTWTHLGHHIEH